MPSFAPSRLTFMAPTVQQFPQAVSVFYTAPGVPGHLPDGTINFYNVPQPEYPASAVNIPGPPAPWKVVTTSLPLCNEPEEKEKLEDAYFPAPPTAPWKKPLKRRSEPPVMINGVQAFKKKSRNVVQISPLRTAFIPTSSELMDLTTHGNAPEKDFEFKNKQLVPKSFLTEPLWSQLIPSNFITKAKAQTCHRTVPCMSIFVLEPQPGKILFRPVHFVVTVTGPGDYVVPVQMRIDCDDNGKELRYVYCFRPQEPGTYTAKVRLAASGVPHVCQSPLKFHISQRTPATFTPHNMMNNNNSSSACLDMPSNNNSPWSDSSNSGSISTSSLSGGIPCFPGPGILC